MKHSLPELGFESTVTVVTGELKPSRNLIVDLRDGTANTVCTVKLQVQASTGFGDEQHPLPKAIPTRRNLSHTHDSSA